MGSRMAICHGLRRGVLRSSAIDGLPGRTPGVGRGASESDSTAVIITGRVSQQDESAASKAVTQRETAALTATAASRFSLGAGRNGGRGNGGPAVTASSQREADNAVTSTGGRLLARGRSSTIRIRLDRRGQVVLD